MAITPLVSEIRGNFETIKVAAWCSTGRERILSFGSIRQSGLCGARPLHGLSLKKRFSPEDRD